MNQIKSIEQQTKTAEKELGGLRKKYEKIKDKHFLRQLEQLDQKQTDQLTKLKKENQAIQTEQKQVDRQLEKKEKEQVQGAPSQELELRNLRNKATYTRKKFEGEREKLIELNQRKKEIKAKEASVRQKETQMIEDAKEKYGIDFQDTEQVAQQGVQEGYRLQCEQLMRKIQVLEGSIQS